MAFWYPGVKPWDLPGAPAHWVRKMAHWLPYHRDAYFMSLQAAMHGTYRPQFVDAPTDAPKDPETVRAAANRRLDEFSDRADAAMNAYRKRRGR